MGFEQGFSLGDSDGPDVFLQGADFSDAVEEAEKIFPRHTPLLFQGDAQTMFSEEEQGFEPNAGPINVSKMPGIAHKRSGLGTYNAFDIVEQMSAKEAHEILLPYFRTTHIGGRKDLIGRVVKQYDEFAKMRSKFLTMNAKLSKADAGYAVLGVPPGLSVGPNLLPHSMVETETAPGSELSITGDPREQEKIFPYAAPFSLPDVAGGVQLCVGSNKACRSTCLIYSGNNPTADSQTMAKMARTTSLLMEPAAWIRMFIESISWNVDRMVRDDKEPYIRPNVLSDIPWELVCPTLFEMFPDVSLYDYTKVVGRTGLANYDLTFSFSGTNTGHTEYELEQGKRVAVVFWLPENCFRVGHQSVRKKRVRDYARYIAGVGPHPDCQIVEDYTFLGRPVITGDLHDFRPLDPAPSIVGLTYKIPKVKGKRLVEPPKAARKFAVIPSGSPKFIVPTFRDTDTGAILVAGTPDQLGAGMVFDDAGVNLVED